MLRTLVYGCLKFCAPSSTGRWWGGEKSVCCLRPWFQRLAECRIELVSVAVEQACVEIFFVLDLKKKKKKKKKSSPFPWLCRAGGRMHYAVRVNSRYFSRPAAVPVGGTARSLPTFVHLHSSTAFGLLLRAPSESGYGAKDAPWIGGEKWYR